MNHYPHHIGDFTMDEIELRFFDELCMRSLSCSEDMGMACDLIAEMNAAIKEMRPIKANYQPALMQFLALNDVLRAKLVSEL